MAPPDAEERRKELKAKLAAKTQGSHKTAKLTKEQQKAKEKAEQDAKKLADAEAKAKAEKVAKAKVAAAAKAAATPPSVWADESDEASQIGIHVGISCDGCGQSPPLIGKAMKCRDCPDFDLCDKCYPDRLDKAREAVAAAAGMPGKGRHPANHRFGPRKAHTVMTREACDKEIAAAEADAKLAAAKDAARRGAATKAEGGDGLGLLEAFQAAARTAAAGPVPSGIWRPSPKYAAICPTPQGPPCVLSPA